MSSSQRYLGIDACQGGWVGILISERAFVKAFKDKDVAEVITAAEASGDICVIGIDIPIGLPTTELRAADLAARTALKNRASTLFNTPTAEALRRPHPEASEINRQALGQGVSAQALALRKGIFEVADLVSDHSQPDARPIIEVHPELSFAHMHDGKEPKPVRFSKKSWRGMRERLDLLRHADIDLPDLLPGVGETTRPDDIIDAAAVAWTARRYHHDRATPFGSGGREKWRITEGVDATIWA